MRWIKPSAIDGEVAAPPSKSMMLRATAAALLAKGESQIKQPSFCNDALAGLQIAEALGAQVVRKDQAVEIRGGEVLQKTELDCKESGLCLRMFTPIAALFAKEITLTGTGSLMTRPVGMMERPLNQLGACCRTNNGFPPVKIKGPIKGGKATIDGSLSSQFLTGLLLSLPLCPDDSEITVIGLKSKPYIAMTLSLLKQFGISIHHEKDLKRFSIKGSQFFKNTTFRIEGDWSSAAFLLVAAAITGKVRIRNLRIDSLQADKKILEVLESAGARVETKSDSVSVEKNQLRAFEFDATECPDLFPPLVVLACFCRGWSVIAGAERLRHKESDRTQALLTEFYKIGARIKVSGGLMKIEGAKLQGGIFKSHDDHRIAMSGAVAGLNTEKGVFLDGWKCVSKSYPSFFEDLKAIGGDWE